ncbi:hypothetical protein C452_07853 [Haloferax volcanii JCM 10717]|uniref:Uncharacterized protein n=1 Tax=Haloferax volcanii JCM 10717 TaxID=1227458 RepID=M0I6U1_HALVO|nr:hypothetical protein [Haloferax alexandrinus]ELZ92515.1 hypothetical protein C452_07853 [Haloferax alexandrinus JCM 10717]
MTVLNGVAYGHSEAAESEDPPDQHRARTRTSLSRPSQTQRKLSLIHISERAVAYGHSEAAESEDPPDQHRARTRTSLSRPSQTQRKRLVRQPGAGWMPADPQLVAAEFERTPGRPHSQP